MKNTVYSFKPKNAGYRVYRTKTTYGSAKKRTGNKKSGGIGDAVISMLFKAIFKK